MKYVKKILSLATNNKIKQINPVLYRISIFFTLSIWLISLIWFAFNLIIAVQDFVVYNNDSKILNCIETEIVANPAKYNFQDNSYNANYGVTYVDPEATLLSYFTTLSYFDGRGFNPSDVKNNLIRCKSQLGSNPFASFAISFLIFVIGGNVLWFFLLKILFWLKFGAD
jgi:hypothetical protein